MCVCVYTLYLVHLFRFSSHFIWQWKGHLLLSGLLPRTLHPRLRILNLESACSIFLTSVCSAALDSVQEPKSELHPSSHLHKTVPPFWPDFISMLKHSLLCCESRNLCPVLSSGEHIQHSLHLFNSSRGLSVAILQQRNTSITNLLRQDDICQVKQL